MKRIIRLLGEEGERMPFKEFQKVMESLEKLKWELVFIRKSDNSGWHIQFEKEAEGGKSR